MSQLWNLLSSAGDLLLVVLGFSAIIIIHEAGHFFAARWAGIRVLAFAVGFGPALCSYRKGLGFRRGSSEPEYLKQRVMDQRNQAGAVDSTAHSRQSDSISSTEYRLNALPFGGYVKMLGQDDADPGATSNEPDSYQNCVPWKRMIVISAGVCFNIITAAVLFIIVFNPAVGLLTEPARIGEVEWGQPAANAVAVNAAQLGVKEPGLKPGDRIVSVNGETPSHFNDFGLSIAMARKETNLDVVVERPGVPGLLQFQIVPETDSNSNMLAIGVSPMASNQILSSGGPRARLDTIKALSSRGFPEILPGMRLEAVDGRKVQSPYELDAAVRDSSGKPVVATFAQPGAGAKPLDVLINPVPELLHAKISFILDGKPVPVIISHLVGLTPVLGVGTVVDEPAKSSGLKAGDIFSRLGEVEWPSVPAGLTEIQSHADKDLPVVVLRQTSPGVWDEVDLKKIHVSKDGRLGFNRVDSASTQSLVSAWPGPVIAGASPSAAGRISAGSRIRAINGQPIGTLAELRDALLRVVAADPAGKVVLSVELPSRAVPNPAPAVEQVSISLTPEEITELSRLRWENPLGTDQFEREKFLWKSETALGAIQMGLHETHRVMMNTYLTFARLFQGSVKVEQLKGPVGIAHVGVAIADRGYIWLLFFMALISVNLAVINFLPMPIADGGHMVFLIYEHFTGRQPSVRVQNASAIVGLAIIGTLFLVVTYHDLGHVFTALKHYFSA